MTVHLVLQGKGGVGKSFVATLLAQYQMAQGQTPLCLDIDPVNATFQGFKALNVQPIEPIVNQQIATIKFDEMLELIGTTKQDVVIDSGASSFIALVDYLTTNHIEVLLHELEQPLILHTVISGGPAFLDTIRCFDQLANQFHQFVIWLNPYLGDLMHDGKPFDQSKAYQQHRAKLKAIITLPSLPRETFGHDLTMMLQDRLTFAEALSQNQRLIVVRHRLKRIQAQIFDQLAQGI